MTIELNFYRVSDNKWVIDLPNWIGPKEHLLMSEGANNIFTELGNMIQKDYITLTISTHNSHLSGLYLTRQNYTLLGGANYLDNRGNNVFLPPIALIIFEGDYPEYIYYTLKY